MTTPSQQRFIWAVYVLKDEDGNIRYVGISKQPARRLKGHIREARSNSTRKSKWISALISKGFSPVMEVVEWTEDWDQAERRWVATAREWGCSLLNATDGGLSVPERLLIGKKNYPVLASYMRQMGQNLKWLKDNKRSPEIIAKMERAMSKVKTMKAMSRKYPSIMGALEERLSAKMSTANV
jgi:predicted GIY-YIG superfamily endonuclease